MRDKEHSVGYRDEGFGWEPSGPTEIGLVLYRYLFSLSLVADIPKEQRGSYLDFGCGTGFGTEIVGAQFQESYGVDRRPECIEYAKRHHGRAGTVYGTGLSTEGRPYDFVAMLEVIEHLKVEDAKELVRIIASHMHPQGLLHITTPIAATKDGHNPENQYHLHEYQPGELKGLLLESFAKVEIVPFGGTFFHAVCWGPKS